MKKAELELYTDYLISTFGAATATGLSSLVDGDVNHDRVTRFFIRARIHVAKLMAPGEIDSSPDREDGVLIFDNTIQEKAWTDENEVMYWHFDHCSGRSVRGNNLLNALYYSGEVSIPVAFERVRKPLQFCDVKTRQVTRASEVTKNELMWSMMTTCVNNALKFCTMLMNSGFASVENFEFIVKKKKHFTAALKDNRLVALSTADKKQGRFVRIDTLELSDKQAVCGWLKGYADEVLLVRQVFTNKGCSTGLLNRVSSNLTGNDDTITTIYQKRWKVELFHKSLKSSAALAKSPTRRITTQNNHVFMAIYPVFKLECLKLKHKTNYFALRAKLFIKATRQAYAELQALQAA
ncbi:IS701 family transposase [Methylobacter tundripaludum]|uniref:IS701 family transposase n=1 Tax=Methylobacter tundripaludum TaxID=173365 RepID=UPI001F35CBB2|nr:transposase [Methylobacter tundripaludum]